MNIGSRYSCFDDPIRAIIARAFISVVIDCVKLGSKRREHLNRHSQEWHPRNNYWVSSRKLVRFFWSWSFANWCDLFDWDVDDVRVRLLQIMAGVNAVSGN